MNTRRTLTAASLAVMATALLAGAAAWACTASAELSTAPNFGAAGSRTTVTGYRFDTSAPVEIRWATRTGPVLARTSGPNFSVEVTVPANAATGDYVIVGMNIDSSFAPATPFRVTASGATTTRTGSSGSRTGSVSGGSVESGSATADAGSAGSSTDEPGGPAAPASDGSEPGGPLTSSVDEVGNASTTSGQRSATARDNTVVAPSRSVSAAGSQMATAPGSTPAATPIEEQVTAPAVGVPSARSAGSDIWGGFAAGDGPVRGPGLSTDVPSGSAGGPTGLAAGIGLLSLAMVALTAGAGVTVLRRRRLAHSA